MRKQDPPNPGPAFKNFEPIRESIPMARETSVTSASVTSHIEAIVLMEEIRWARKALDTSFESSLLQRLVVIKRSFETQ